MTLLLGIGFVIVSVLGWFGADRSADFNLRARQRFDPSATRPFPGFDERGQRSTAVLFGVVGMVLLLVGVVDLVT